MIAYNDAEELVKLLTSSIKTVKEKSRQANLITNN